jgi:hypothetical protein
MRKSYLWFLAPIVFTGAFIFSLENKMNIGVAVVLLSFVLYTLVVAFHKQKY